MATRTSVDEIMSAELVDFAELFIKKWWAFREIAVVIVGFFAVAVAVGALAGHIVGFFAVAMVAPFGLLSGEVRALFGEWYTKGRHRAAETFTRYSWELTCYQDFGWSSRGGQGMILVPELLDLELSEDRSSIAYTFRPLSTQLPKEWPKMAQQLAQHHGMSKYRIEQLAPDVIKVVLSDEQLPTVVPYDYNVQRSVAWHQVPIGVDATGDTVTVDLLENPHTLVAGSTGSGKGSILRNFALHGLLSGYQEVIINPRLSGEFVWAERLDVPVAAEYDAIVQVLDRIFDEMKHRQVMLQNQGVSSWVKLTGVDNIKPIMLLVDELPTLLTPNKANKDVAKQQLHIGDLLAKISSIGRASGVYMVGAAQRPDASALGPSGGQLRNNIDNRISVGNLDKDGLRMMFGSASEDVLGEAMDGVKGRALISAGNNGIRQVQLYYADETDLLTKNITPQVAQVGRRILEARAVGVMIGMTAT